MLLIPYRVISRSLWSVISRSLCQFNLPGYFRNTIGAEEGGIYPCGKQQVRQVYALSALLWNLGINRVFDAPLPGGEYITCYVEDTVIIAGEMM